jgi:hypothetical protein
MKTLKNIFQHLETIIGTEGAFNVFMVEYKVRKSFFEALVFSTILKLNNYMKKYKTLLIKFKNIDLYIFEIVKNIECQYTVRFMIYQKIYEKDIKKIKSYKDHKQIGYMLDYSCPKNIDGKNKVSYSLYIIKDKYIYYKPKWLNPNKIIKINQNNIPLFSYVCTHDKLDDFNNIKKIGKKCMNLISTMKLPYTISIIHELFE